MFVTMPRIQQWWCQRGGELFPSNFFPLIFWSGQYFLTKYKVLCKSIFKPSFKEIDYSCNSTYLEILDLPLEYSKIIINCSFNFFFSIDFLVYAFAKGIGKSVSPPDYSRSLNGLLLVGGSPLPYPISCLWEFSSASIVLSLYANNFHIFFSSPCFMK